MDYGVDEVTRRTFLTVSAAAILAAQTACTSGGGKGNGKDGKTGANAPFPFGFWAGMQNAARSSSDHTRAAADRAVATGDVTKIFTFVRDEIALYPPPPGAYDPATAIRWGVDATLRCGAGTLREKADVLVELYRRAGFQTELFQDTYAVPAGTDPYAPPKRVADPHLDSGDVARWRKDLGLPKDPVARPAFDHGGTDSAAIADAVLRALGPINVQTGDPAVPSGGPIVKVTVPGKGSTAGTVHWAIPLAGFELATSLRSTPTQAVGPAVAPSITVALSMTSRDAPDKPVELVTHTWTADQLVGRQVMAQFTPPYSLDELLQMKVRDVGLFAPTLAVRRPGDDAKTIADNVVTGSAVTFAAEVVEDKDGAITVSGQPISVARDTGDRSSVTRVEVRAQAGHFPTVELVVSAFDSAGRPVDRLPAAAFTVRDGDAAVGVIAHSNSVPPKPRLLVIYDGSLSMGTAFVDDPGKRAFGRAFATAIAKAIPGVELVVSSTDGSTPPTTAKPADPTTLAQDIAVGAGISSIVPQSVALARIARPTVIVLVSDGGDGQLPLLRGQLRADIETGAPVVAVLNAAADKSDPPTMRAIAKVSHGTDVTIHAPTEVAPIVNGVLRVLGQHRKEPYRLGYEAPIAGPATRTVTVSVGPTAKATATYTVPSVGQRAVRPGIAGIHLTVTVGSEFPVVRTLAGMPPDTRPGTVYPKDLDTRIRNGLWGVTAISFEGAAPSLSTWLDDHATGLLASRKLWEGAQKSDGKAMRAGYEDGVALLPTELIGLHAPLLPRASGEGTTYERLFRVALVTHHPNFGNPAGPLRRGDILPVTSFDTTGADRKKAYAMTMRQSARLAVGERAMFDTSAARLLDGARLVLSPGLPTTAHLSDAETARWNHVLSEYPIQLHVLPVTGKPLSFWMVDPRTGALIGVLDDATGGGRSYAAARSSRAHAGHATAPCIDDLSDQAFNALGALGGGIYAAVGKACARIFARAARTLTTGPVPDTGDPNDILKDAACDIAKDALLGQLGGFGEIAGPIDDMADMFGKDLPCPGGAAGGGRATC